MIKYLLSPFIFAGLMYVGCFILAPMFNISFWPVFGGSFLLTLVAFSKMS
jgi:hypothetical protein